MLTSKSQRIFGMTYLQIGVLAGLGVVGLCLVGYIAIVLLFRNQPVASPAPNLPPHTVNDYWDTGKGINFAYFIVADKSLTKEEAKRIIAYYENKHPDYKILNIWIFCDTVYANEKTINDDSITDDQFFSHVLYWYLAGELTNVGMSFISDPSEGYPTLGSACK